ncbi:receptor-like kinase TMK3 [Abrus precatorius]|uniref:non-specific serine/threonine protein kinase n=1 Tax=Abrus precatorius TaxID=3816 RepID=A0A8B8KF80_ABRPR|nr:receptor-like kinase TMK3 [Abrus precatorius]XP_027342461.1 receptor-like kinase TMK3 [Abrus precatorius]
MEVIQIEQVCILFCFGLFVTLGYGATDPNDVKVLNDFRKGLENPDLLKWPENGDDPCGPPSWPYVYCSGDRVNQIQAKNLGLRGSLPQNFNQLSELYNLGLQRNNLSGMLPTFSGLSKLEFAFLDYNAFDAIPSDFFDGLTSIRVLSLEENPLNASSGWLFPKDLEKSVQLTNLSLVQCNLVGPLPDFVGTLPSLTNLRLSGNELAGAIPATFAQSSIQVLWLNDQQGGGLTGPIDVIASMIFLRQLWLHGNQFTGTIPRDIGNLTSLQELNLNSNQLVGLIPESLAHMNLDILVLNNNKLMGPIPEFKAANFSYDNNFFCQTKPGLECAPEVTTLLDFLDKLNYPSFLISDWSGNEPCRASTGTWFGLSCNSNSEVSIINLPRHKLNGTLSPSLASLDSLLEIRLAGNNITGIVPGEFSELKSLRLLDLSDNNLEPPLPKFHNDVKFVIVGNPLLPNQTGESPTPSPIPIRSPPSPQNPSRPPSSHKPLVPSQNSRSNQSNSKPNGFKRFKTVAVVAGVAVFAVIALLVVYLLLCCRKNQKASLDAPSSIVVHPRDPSDPDNVIKIAVSNNNTGSLSTKTGTSSLSNISGETQNSHMLEAGNLVISVQVLRKVTDNFCSENELGRGGFGTVYKGELEDGTKIAVKRMEHGVISSKAQEEFQAEIAVLSKVRHRHLVSLLGYSVEGNERLLVYEYMPLGALSQHLFHWKSLKLEPLSWSQRLAIALDVARGIEYLHSLARQTFIHRDLKSSNILLGDDFRAEVSDFGLVKLAPDGEKSVVTKLAGTFGYLAPEYAVMGKITTKVDVFSYGVVLMELLTGLMALDESRPEESRYLAEWFWQIKVSKEKLMAAIDPALEATEETFETITIVAELAGHCTAREAHHRPDMSHAVNVLAALVEKWRPVNDELDYYSGIDYTQPLPQMLKIWKEAESKEFSYDGTSLEDSRSSIAARPIGFADSFTSADAR